MLLNSFTQPKFFDCFEYFRIIIKVLRNFLKPSSFVLGSFQHFKKKEFRRREIMREILLTKVPWKE